MTLSGEEIQANLARFVKRWSGYAGPPGESEAPTLGI
jgi:hypothetical protein